MDFHVHKDDIDHENFYCIPLMSLEDALRDAAKNDFNILYGDSIPMDTMGFINQNNDAWIDFIPIQRGDYVRFEHVSTEKAEPNILECSSKGDRRFSAFYAKVKLFGKYDSIENHYQLSKRFGDEVPETWKDAKGKKPTHLHINGKDFDVKFTEAWYDLLWVTYLHNHPKLVNHASKFDEFNDIFKSKGSVVCQADSIRKFMTVGRQSILDEHGDFIKEVRK